MPALRLVGGVHAVQRSAVILRRAAEERPSRELVREVAGALPAMLRLIWALARDERMPRRHRIALWALVPYIASPIDLLPDVLPGIGGLDDAALVLVVLRWVLRNAVARELLDEHWAGSPAMLRILRELTDVPEPDQTPPRRR